MAGTGLRITPLSNITDSFYRAPSGGMRTLDGTSIGSNYGGGPLVAGDLGYGGAPVGGGVSGGPSAGGSSSSSTASFTASNGTAPIPAPNMNGFTFSQDSLNYPAYLKNLGENMAQQQFQSQVNQGLRAGNAGNSYLKAQDQMNMARLNYMGQAGQQSLGVDKAQADEVARRNAEILQRYGIQVGQRGQDLNYAAMLASANSRQQPVVLGGGQNPLTSSQLRSQQTGSGTNSYIDIYGNRASDPSFSGSMVPNYVSGGGNIPSYLPQTGTRYVGLGGRSSPSLF